MYYKSEWVWNNICILDSHDMNLEPQSGDHCFIIGHHVKHQSVLDRAAKILIMGGFCYFNIFGEQAELWEEAILKKAEKKDLPQIETSKVAREEMSYNLAMLATLKPGSMNYVFSDDEYFTEYLVQDVQDIVSGKSKFTPYDWQKFRRGFEFNYHGKDAIISISNGVVVGFLREAKSFRTIMEGFRYELFDGKSFNEIWEEISNTP